MGAVAAPADSTAPVADAPAHNRNNMLLRVALVAYVAALAGLCFWQHRTLFAWPAGIVTGNLLASAIWAPLAVVHLDRLARRHHREHLAILHRHHTEHMQALAGGRPAGAEGLQRRARPPRKDGP